MFENTLPAEKIVLYDGVCNVCDTFVNFIIDRDPVYHIRTYIRNFFVGLEKWGTFLCTAE